MATDPASQVHRRGRARGLDQVSRVDPTRSASAIRGGRSSGPGGRREQAGLERTATRPFFGEVEQVDNGELVLYVTKGDPSQLPKSGALDFDAKLASPSFGVNRQRSTACPQERPSAHT